MMAFAGFAFAIAGFDALALSMDRHHREAIGGVPSRRTRRALIALGWTMLAVSLAACHRAWGPSLGLVFWSGLLTVCALVVVLAFTYAPRLGSRLALCGVPVGIAAMLLSLAHS